MSPLTSRYYPIFLEVLRETMKTSPPDPNQINYRNYLLKLNCLEEVLYEMTELK